jgi:hypothetical protein
MRRGGRREREGLDLKEPISVARLIGRFAVVGVVVLALVSALTALASRRIGTDQAIADAQRVTYTTGKGIIEPLLDPRLLEQDRDALEHLDRAVRDTVLRGSLVRVKLWSQDGVVLYSDESRLIGQQFELAADELEVFETGETHAEVSDLGSDENRFETESKLLEVYQQLYTTTGEPVLYEAYFRYSGVAAVGRKLWTQFAPIAVGALVLLQLVQIPLAWSMARRLRAGQLERERLLRHDDASRATCTTAWSRNSPVCPSGSPRSAAPRRSHEHRCSRPPRPSATASSRCGRSSSRSTRRTSTKRGSSRPSATC